MIGAKSQLKWFWRSVAPVVVLFVILKVESASARFVTDPQTTPKPCVRLQRKVVWKRAPQNSNHGLWIKLLVWVPLSAPRAAIARRRCARTGSSLGFPSVPRRGWEPADDRGGGRTFRPPEPAECRIWLLSAVFMPGKTAANRRRPGGPSMARRLMAKNRLADRPRVCAGPSFVQRCANSMIRHRLPKNSVRRHQAERAKQRHARTYGSARPADPVDGSLSRERWISLK